MKKKDIKFWFIDRGYSLSLSKRTEVYSVWYRVGNAQKEIRISEAYSSKPYDYAFLLKLINNGEFSRLELYQKD